jgi:hypothetical protein
MSEVSHREVAGANAAVSQCHELPVHHTDADGEVLHHGTVTVEYQPHDAVLDAAGMVAATTSDIPDGVSPERLVAAVYHNVLHAIFSGYTGREEPWESVPLVVSYAYEYDRADHVNAASTATLGGYL